MSKREQNKVERKKKMIEAARIVFDQKGIEMTKMTDVAEEAGIGVASLYRYYKTKLDLALDVGVVYWENLVIKLESIKIEHLNGVDALAELMQIYTVQDDFMDGFFRFIEQLDYLIAKSSDIEMTHYEAVVETLEPLFDGVITRGIKDKSIRSDINVHEAYIMISHTLTALKQKHCSRGHILSGDTNDFLNKEMSTMVHILLDYIKLN